MTTNIGTDFEVTLAGYGLAGTIEGIITSADLIGENLFTRTDLVERLRSALKDFDDRVENASGNRPQRMV
jgi:hypothetical protein